MVFYSEDNFREFEKSFFDKDLDVPTGITYLANTLNNDATIIELLRLWDDLDYDFYEEVVINAFRQITTTKLINLLVELLDAPDLKLAKPACYLLGNIGGEQAIEPLIKTLTHSNYGMKCTAAFGLGEIGSSRATKYLIAHLFDTNEAFRADITTALGKIKDEAAITPLINTFLEEISNPKFGEGVVMMRIGEALGQIGGQKVLDFFNSMLEKTKFTNPDIDIAIILGLGCTQNSQAIDRLIEGLQSQDKDIRMYAIRTLIEFRDPRIVQKALEVLEDENSFVRRYAALALKNQGDKAAVKPLIRHLKDEADKVRAAVVRALGVLGDKSVIPTLLEMWETDKGWYGGEDMKFYIEQAIEQIQKRN